MNNELAVDIYQYKTGKYLTEYEWSEMYMLVINRIVEKKCYERA